LYGETWCMGEKIDDWGKTGRTFIGERWFWVKVKGALGWGLIMDWTRGDRAAGERVEEGTRGNEKKQQITQEDREGRLQEECSDWGGKDLSVEFEDVGNASRGKSGEAALLMLVSKKKRGLWGGGRAGGRVSGLQRTTENKANSENSRGPVFNAKGCLFRTAKKGGPYPGEFHN